MIYVRVSSAVSEYSMIHFKMQQENTHRRLQVLIRLDRPDCHRLWHQGLFSDFSAFFPIFPDLLQTLEHGTGPGTAYSHMIILGHGT